VAPILGISGLIK